MQAGRALDVIMPVPVRTGWRRVIKKTSISFAVLLVAAVFAKVVHAQETLETIDSARLLVTDAVEIPAGHAPGWQTVNLTDRWPLSRYESGRHGWYHATFLIDEIPRELLAIYLRRLNMNAEIFLNGEKVASGGRFTEPISRNWNYPMYAEPVLSQWRVGDNDIHIRHISYPGYGYISPIYVGPAMLLADEYDLHRFLQVEIAQYLFPLTFTIGLFIFAIWLLRRQDYSYLWFALAVVSWSVYIVNMFVQDLIVPTKVWEWCAHFSFELWVVSFSVFLHLFAGQSMKWRRVFYAAFLLLVAVTYAVSDLTQLKTAARYLHGAGVFIGLSVLVSLIGTWLRTRSTTVLVLMGGLLVLLLTGIHDWMFQYGFVGVTGQLSLHLHYYCAPLVFGFITWHLASRFAIAMNESEALNAELESRVKDAEAELRDRYAELQRLGEEQAIVNERERISREIHDGLGGNFANAIMMTDLLSRENRPDRVQRLKTMLQDGLTEVRHLITTMAGDISSAQDLVRYINEKSQTILAAADIELTSRIEVSDKPVLLAQSRSLNLVRVFQEAANNIVKHAHAKNVEFVACVENGRLTLSMIDDGDGFTSANGKGYGLLNIDKRCAEIDAMLTIDSREGGGTSVAVTLQLEPLVDA